MRRNALVGIAIVAAIVFGAAIAGVGAPIASVIASTGRGAIDPGNFVRHVTNPYFPLKPGTRLVYRGVKDGQTQVDRVFVTYRTKTIEGVHTTVVRDIARHKGHVLERTFDWYAQDKQGTVWYFGENTKSFENGHVNREGSWRAGVDGARPGIIMPADPHPAQAYRQEFYKDHAEDQAWLVKRGGSVGVPYGKLHHKLVSFEWSRIEPRVVDKKVYARGFGIVQEVSKSGPHETADLVQVHRP
jgi:hypothetical protein